MAPAILLAAQAAGIEPAQGLFLGDRTVVQIGVRGELYVMGSDLVVFRSRGLSCIGYGRHAGYPVMEALDRAGVGPARRQIEMTLEIVAQHVPVVAPPFRFLEQSADEVPEECSPAG